METELILTIPGGQTVSNHSQYPVGNTIQAYSGYFQMQYLGEGEEQPLYNDFGSSYKGPLFNILNANTEGFYKTDSMGRIIGSEDTTPIRMHSDTTLDGKKVGLFSGGCPMFPLSELEEVQQKLEEWGVKRGDTFNGYIKQDFPQ